MLRPIEPRADPLSLTLIWFCAFATFTMIDINPVRYLVNLREPYLILTIPLSGLMGFFMFWEINWRLVTAGLQSLGSTSTKIGVSRGFNKQRLITSAIIVCASAKSGRNC